MLHMAEQPTIDRTAADSLASVMSARTRARTYWDADGVSTIIGGLILSLFALAIYLAHRATSTTAEVLADLLRLSALLLMLEESALGKIATWLKARTTFPRTGYIAPPASVTSEACTKLTPEDKDRLRRDLFPLLASIGLVYLGVFADRRWLVAVGFAVLALLIWRRREPEELVWPKTVAIVVLGCLATLLPLPIKPSLDIALIRPAD